MPIKLFQGSYQEVEAAFNKWESENGGLNIISMEVAVAMTAIAVPGRMQTDMRIPPPLGLGVDLKLITSTTIAIRYQSEQAK